MTNKNMEFCIDVAMNLAAEEKKKPSAKEQLMETLIEYVHKHYVLDPVARRQDVEGASVRFSQLIENKIGRENKLMFALEEACNDFAMCFSAASYAAGYIAGCSSPLRDYVEKLDKGAKS